MIRTHDPELFAGQPEAALASKLGARTCELSDFLLPVLHAEDASKKCLKTSAYNDFCAELRELGVKAQSLVLLPQVEGLSLNRMEGCEPCCGICGTFALKYGVDVVVLHVAEMPAGPRSDHCRTSHPIRDSVIS